MLVRARRVLAEADALREDVAALQGLDGRRIALGTMPAMAAVDAPALVARFRDRHPGVGFVLRTGTATSIFALLASGQLDAAFVGSAVGELPAELTGEDLGLEPLLAILPEGDPRAVDPVVRLADLRDVPLVSLGAGSAFGAAVIAALRAAGVEPRVATEAWEPATARALVAEGLGIAIVPRFLAEARG